MFNLPNSRIAAIALIMPLSVPAYALNLDLGVASVSVGHGSVASVNVGGSGGVNATVGGSGETGGGSVVEVSIGGGGTGGSGTTTTDGGVTTYGTGGGTDVAGIDPNSLILELGDDALGIIGSSVWTNDTVLVGMVTSIESQSGDKVVVRVAPVEGFDLTYSTLRFSVAARAFRNNQLMLPQGKNELIEQLG